MVVTTHHQILHAVQRGGKSALVSTNCYSLCLLEPGRLGYTILPASTIIIPIISLVIISLNTWFREDNLHCSSTTYVLNSLLPAVQTSSCRLLNKCSKVLNITRQCLTWKLAWNLCTINIWVYMGHIILISQLTVWCPRSLRQMNVQVMIFSTDSKLCENKTTFAALRMIGGAVTYWSLLPHCLQLPCLVFSMWETRLAKLHTGDQARQTCLSKHEMNTCNLRSIHS